MIGSSWLVVRYGPKGIDMGHLVFVNLTYVSSLGINEAELLSRTNNPEIFNDLFSTSSKNTIISTYFNLLSFLGQYLNSSSNKQHTGSKYHSQIDNKSRQIQISMHILNWTIHFLGHTYSQGVTNSRRQQ